jgi:hypothetical protein
MSSKPFSSIIAYFLDFGKAFEGIERVEKGGISGDFPYNGSGPPVS